MAERTIVIAALGALVVSAWAYLLAGAGMEKHVMDGMLMPVMRSEWTAGYFVLVLAMWAVMMLAMMLPSAAPMILLHAAISRKTSEAQKPIAATALFVLGYVAVWAGFSVSAALLQWMLASAALLSPMMQTSSKG